MSELNENKPLCVFGVLKTAEGLKIKEEMLEWLNPLYNVLCIEQDPPGIMFEYPAIKYALKLSIEMNEPVLYIHTKGAANPNHDFFQPIVRNVWKDFWGCKNKIKVYYDTLKDSKNAEMFCLFSNNNRTCWFNSFIINPIASKELLNNLKSPNEIKNRYYYENMFNDNKTIKMNVIINDNINTPTEMVNIIKKYK